MNNIPAVLVWVLTAVFIIGPGVLVWKKGWREGLRASSKLLLVEWVFLILCTAVIYREVRDVRAFNLIPFDSYLNIPENSYFIEAAAVNVLNVIMFIPIGLLLGLGFREVTWKKVLLISLGVSFSIELLQFIFKRGLCETDDLIHNVLGTIIGYALLRVAYLLTSKYEERKTII